VVTGGTSPYTYSFNAGSFTATTSYTGLTAGTYTITVQDANGCSFTINPVVANTPGPTAIVATPTSSTCGGANGAIILGAVTGGTAPYSYSIGASAFTTTTSYTGLSANTYAVIVKDANGCTFTSSATITDLSGLTASITAQTNVSCNGASNGSVTITAGGSAAPYSYSLNGAAFVASGTFAGLTAGSYTVTAKDGNGCTVVVPVTITQPSVLTGAITAQTNITCFGANNGSVTVSAGGATPGYTYSIDGGVFGASATFNGLNGGAHTVVAKDANGCTVNIAVTITEPTSLTLVTSSVNATCTAANGSASVTASGATPVYTYLWSPGSQTSATAINITAGNYSVLVTDSHGCSQTALVTVGQNLGATAVISSTTNVSCTGASDGSATVSMGAGATPPFTYAWTPSSQTTVTATGLSPATYSVTVTDGNGCIATTNTTITEPTIITSSFTNVNEGCFGGSTASSTINTSGGTAPYGYLWTPTGQTTPTAIGLTAGTYTCVITDAHGCTKTSVTTISEPSGMSLTETHLDAHCGQADGTVKAFPSGGTGPYTYSWNTLPVQTTQTVTGLPANTYAATVTDANGCSQTISVTVGNLAGPVASIFGSNNVSCNGLNDGSATGIISGGTAPYTFLWSNAQALPTATNLVAGSYTLTATDMTGCIATTSVIITEPTVLNTGFGFTDPHCNGSSDGTITTSTSGGTSPYTYLWTPGGMTTPAVTGLSAGSYSMQATDAHGCNLTTSFILSNPAAVSGSTTVTNVSCSGLCNGSATVSPLTGTGPFTYAWSDINAQTTQTATGLCSGTFVVTLTDANGCTATANANVTSPTALSMNLVTSGNVTCFGACDGFAQVAVTGGSAPFSFNWMPGGTAGASVNNLCAGTYTVTVTDANGCSAVTNVLITQPNALVATITNTNVTCFGACDAQATAVYTGGTGPYTFLWTPTLQTTPTATNLCAGIHDLTVTDSHACQAFASVTITQPTVLAVTTTTTSSTCGNADGSACSAIIGGSPPFVYSWNDPALQTTSCANSLNAGVYTISVTDSHGCSVTNVANVNDINAPVVTIPTSSNVTCFGAANGSAQGAITGGVVPYNILWTPSSQVTAFASGLSGGIYSIVVTDSVGCTGSASVTINEPASLVSAITATSNTSCNLACDGSATVLAGGGTTPYTYLWNSTPVQTATTASNLCAASYTVTTTDANGCTSASVATITQPAALNITLVSSTNVSCNGGNNGAITISASGGTPGYTYTWLPAVGAGPSVTNLVAGSYQVTVTDAHGCSKTSTIDIMEPAAMVLTANSNNSTCGDANGSAGISVTGGVSAYSYLWTPSSANTAIITGVMAGVYNVTVTDLNGCTATAASTVSNTAGPVISSITYTEPLCNGTPTGTATVIANLGTPLYTYLWSGPGAQTSPTANAFPVGTYTVTVSDANHCSVVGTVVVTQPAPVQIIGSPVDTICIGQLTQVYAAGFGGTPPYNYIWSPATITGTGITTILSPTTTTTYTVFATDAHGCLSPQAIDTIIVRPQIDVTATDVTVCSGSAVTISASATGGTGGTPPYSYTWSNGATGSSQTVSPTSSPTNYIVTVNDGCSIPVSDTSTVIVYPLAVSFMTVPDTSGCQNFMANFTGLSDVGVSYLWNFGDGGTSTLQNPNYLYTSNGSFNVSLTVTTIHGCVSTITNNNFIDVFPAPNADFSANPQSTTTTAPQITFTDLSTGAITNWAWDFGVTGTLSDTSSTQNPVYSYADSSIYTVQLIVTNSFGCTDTATSTVDVEPEYVLFAPNAFTPNNHDGLNDTFMPQGVGIDPDNFEMDIFDRWGNNIYKTNDIYKGWDGKANGGSNIAQIDTYVWKIRTKDFRGVNHSYVGHVSIIK
jgi:gliding motility-associated-like protein